MSPHSPFSSRIPQTARHPERSHSRTLRMTQSNEPLYFAFAVASAVASAKSKKGPSQSPDPHAHTKTYCGGGGGVAVIGFGGSGAFGAVNPGITGACPTVPFAAS